MLLTITNTEPPATDLGYLLCKNPARRQSFELPFGQAHVFCPEASAERCTAALLLEINGIAVARQQQGSRADAALAAYVNDRPYVASSFLSVAIARVFGTALSGRSKERPELAASRLPLEARLPAVRCHGGEALVRRLFEPLGYSLAVEAHALDPMFPDWGDSECYTVTLAARCRLRDLLAHLYVLVPVLDEEKHYWVGEEEVEKLLRHGAGWLGAHPEHELIARRYLKRQRDLMQEALRRLADEDVQPAEADREGAADEAEERLATPRLSEQRLAAVIAGVKEAGARTVIDLGCGEGSLLRALMEDRELARIAGMDVSPRALSRAQAKLGLDRLSPAQRERVELFHGSLTYRDRRLAGYDVAVLVEVIEHVDPPRLAALERAVFEYARPRVVLVTTPNREYNALFPGMRSGSLRHRDHRFEWTREEFQGWCLGVAGRRGYSVAFRPIGPEDQNLGAPTQMGVFTQCS